MPDGRERRTTMEDNVRYPQLLLTSLCIVALKPLFLPASGASYPSCLASSSPKCARLLNSTLFPFVASEACGSTSTMGISGCAQSDTDKHLWRGFVHATGPFDRPPEVKPFNNSFQNLLPTDLKSIAPISATNVHGFINLTWNMNLTREHACNSVLPLVRIKDDIPPSIDLTSFARSAFRLSPFNIILFFNCNEAAMASQGGLSFQKNDRVCESYRNGCHILDGEESWNCYRYAVDSKELNLTKAMDSAVSCQQAMFFVTSDLSMAASRWTPGLIQLDWSSADSPWIANNTKLCAGCLQTGGACGYDDHDNFKCFCPQSWAHGINCTAVSGPSSPAANKSTGCKNFTCRVATKAAFGAGGFAVALLLSLLLFCILKRKRANTHHASPRVTGPWMKKPSFLSRKQDPISAKEMSLEEIILATESFAEAHKLGDGGFGAVYKGVLPDGRKVAVKRLYNDSYRRLDYDNYRIMEHFYNEIKVLSNLAHPNLIELYGFCCEDAKELLLVFEYARHGTVSDYLHNGLRGPMSWSIRLRIACETANALSYLHNSVVPPIYHRDVKTTNILLGEGLHVKLADFGLSKFVPLTMTHVSTAPQGTPGYLDPEYQQCYQLTDKSDVYSFGVVLMELISAKPAVDMSRDRGEINLSTYAIMKIKCGQLEQLVDPALEMTKDPCVERSIKRVVEVAFQCLHAERDERPSMCLVAEMLNDIRREDTGYGGDGEHRPHNACTSLTTAQSHPSGGLNKAEDSPHSVLFSSGSSNPSSTLST